MQHLSPPQTFQASLIFSLSLGKGTTFYSWLDVPHTASTAQIAKAYRKKSLQLQ